MNIDQTITMLKLINEETHPTGSMAFGLPCPMDDDRFCEQSVFDRIRAMMQLDQILICEANEYTQNHSLRFILAGQIYHIFVVKPAEIPVLTAVTEMVRIVSNTFPKAMQKKAFRILLYRHLRDTLNMMRQECEI